MPEEISIEILYTNIPDTTDYARGTILKTDISLPRFIDHGVRRKHLLGGWLATTLLRRFGVTDLTSELRTSAFGKPYIPSLPAFNISHSTDMIVCAMASYGEIGIDIESIRPLDREQYRDSFSPLEWIRISAASDPCECMLDLWTQKESLLKADGRGLQVPMSRVKFPGSYGQIENEAKRWYLTPVPIAGCFCHVCTEYPVGRASIQKAENFPGP